MKSQKDIDFCILILSCDRYRDLWDPFFANFHAKWPNCPYPLFLGSNTVRYSGNNRVATILSGEDNDWSSSLIKILKQLPYKHIFLWLDDIFPTNNIQIEEFQKGIQFLTVNNASHIHMRPTPKPDIFIVSSGFGEYQAGAPYRVNALGFWNRRALLDLLIEGENPWNFEIMGSYRSKYLPGFYCFLNPMFNYINAVEKGMITKEASNYFKKNHIVLKQRSRNLHNTVLDSLSKCKAIIFNIVASIPWKFRVDLMNLFRKLLISY